MVFLPDFLGPVMQILVNLGIFGSYFKYFLGMLRNALRLF